MCPALPAAAFILKLASRHELPHTHAHNDYAEQHELREGNPVAHVDRPKWDARDPVIISDQEFERLLDECAGRDMLAHYVLTIGNTGVRCESEGLYIKWDDVDLEGGFIRIWTGREGHRTKGGKGRWVPVTRRLLTAMKAHFARYRFTNYDGKPSPWVFHHTRNRRHYKAGDRIKSFYDSSKATAARAKLPKEFRQHDLRHRRATSWLAEGQSPALVQKALGHADIRTTLGYMHLVREHLRVLVEPNPAEATRGSA